MAHLKAKVYRLLHTQFLLFSKTLLPKKISANWTLFVLWLCSAKRTQFTAIETFEKHNGRPNKLKPGAPARYTNIEGTKRHKSVPTILTETVVGWKNIIVVYWDVTFLRILSQLLVPYG